MNQNITLYKKFHCNYTVKILIKKTGTLISNMTILQSYKNTLIGNSS